MAKEYNKTCRVVENVDDYLDSKKRDRTKRVNEKMDSIKGEGYAERQIEDSLRRAGKIRTEL